MGRPSKPIEQKIREGNAGKRKLPVPVATVPGIAEIPLAPSDLESAGQRFWADVWVAGHAWLSPQLDAGTVETAARTFDECETYRRALSAGPLLREPIVTPTGVVVGNRLVPNPAELMLRRARRELERWLMVLAIPPTARARLGLVQVRAQSALEDLLTKRSGQPDDVIDVDDWGEDG